MSHEIFFGSIGSNQCETLQLDDVMAVPAARDLLLGSGFTERDVEHHGRFHKRASASYGPWSEATLSGFTDTELALVQELVLERRQRR